MTTEHEDAGPFAGQAQQVCVVGLGYAGLTLAAVLAERGFTVFGYDRDPERVGTIAALQPPFFEAGLAEALERYLDHRLHVTTVFEPRPYDVVIFAVSTPVRPEDRQPDLRFLREAVRDVGREMVGAPLVIIRSTVPAGTTEQLAAILREGRPDLPVAYAPERTIQGQALEELKILPQVVGGVDEFSLERAVAFFGKVVRRIVPVSSARTAEFVKLINNAHTDVIYGFGNEVALLAEQLGIDPDEAISAANHEYPRPKLHRPGYVGGSCLTKDPYLLAASTGYQPQLILSARQLNERIIAYTCERVIARFQTAGVSLAGVSAVVCGIAYKGTPPTDDIRGSQAIEIIRTLGDAGMLVYGHDPLVSSDKIAAFGAEPVPDPLHPRGIGAYLFLTDQPAYARLDLHRLLNNMKRPGVLFDAWRLFSRQRVEAAGITYQSIGV